MGQIDEQPSRLQLGKIIKATLKNDTPKGFMASVIIC